MPSPDIDCDALIDRFVADDTLALLLVGSHARGDAGPMSDVDLARHVAGPDGHGRLSCHVDGAGRLVTVKNLDSSREKAALDEPGEAVWQVPALREAVVLFDRDGGAGSLIRRAKDFAWDDLGAAPDRHVASEVAAYAEEALKIAGGLAAGRPGQVLYGTVGMTIGLAEAMTVLRRRFITSENRLFDVALEAMSDEPTWTAAFRVAAGFSAADPALRGQAALNLYACTADAVMPLLDLEQRAVAATGIGAARRFL